MKNILFDCRAIFDSGIGAYTREILVRLVKHSNVSVIVSKNDINRFNELSINVDDIIVVGFGRLSWRNISFISKYLAYNDYFFSPTFVLFFNRKKMLVTIHDVCLLDCRKFFSFSSVALFFVLVGINAFFSKNVFTISKFSKHRIVEFFRFINPRKIIVLYNGRNSFFRKLAKTPGISENISFDLSGKIYYLTVGNIKPHKNFRNLCRYWTQSNNDSILVIVGSSDGLRTKEELNHTDNVIFTGYISDEDLATLYKNATAFIYPSLYEGFGLPLLEAMEFNLPIAASDIPVFHEIAGNDISYFNPYNFDKLSGFIADKKVKIDYQDTLANFDWDYTVKGILKVIESENSTN